MVGVEGLQGRPRPLPAQGPGGLVFLAHHVPCHHCRQERRRAAGKTKLIDSYVGSSKKTRLGVEKHVVFECAKLQHIRGRYARLFKGFDTMRSFMNQASQQDVMNFVSDCLDSDAQLVGGDQQMRPHEEEGTDP